MNRATLAIVTIILLLGAWVSAGCGISATALKATHEVVIRPNVATEVWQMAEATLETAVPATQTAAAVTQEIALLSFHGRYVTATGGGSGWLLRQEPGLSPCGWFTLHHLDGGKVALQTCHDRYVTAPETGATEPDWMLWQESELGDCGRFVLHERSDGVAFETCAGRFFTAGDLSWEPGLEWAVIGKTYDMQSWELFTVLRH